MASIMPPPARGAGRGEIAAFHLITSAVAVGGPEGPPLRSCAVVAVAVGLPAARWIASRMRVYVAQRQRLPLIARSMSASVGRALRRSSAAADMICPAWQ